MRGRTWRPISIRSRNPTVVIIATRPPVRWIRAFVAIVVPCAKVADVLGANAVLSFCDGQPIKDSARRVLGSRWHLMDNHFIGRSIEQAEVSEGPTDINAHNPAHLFFLPSSFSIAAARMRIKVSLGCN